MTDFIIPETQQPIYSYYFDYLLSLPFKGPCRTLKKILQAELLAIISNFYMYMYVSYLATGSFLSAGL